MKAVLQEKGVVFGKVHDLEILLNNCKQIVPGIEFFKEEIIWLTSFAVEIRYPGFNAKKKEAVKALTAMKKIAKVLRSYLKKQ
jgi:HEPN domain-containing protein